MKYTIVAGGLTVTYLRANIYAMYKLASPFLALAGLYILLSLSAAPAFAGAFRIAGNQILFNSGEDRKIGPGFPITIEFDASSYEFGSEKLSYLVFAVVPVNGTSGSNWMPRDTDRLYYILMRDRLSDNGGRVPLDRVVLKFRAPLAIGSYRVMIHSNPLFNSGRLSPNDMVGDTVEATGATKARAFNHLRDARQFSSQLLIFGVSPIIKPTNKPPLYLKADGRMPAFTQIVGGVRPGPVIFDWYVGPESTLDRSKFEYRYQLWPVDSDYGAWTRDKSVSYHFLPKGFLRFSVEGRYRNDDQTVQTLPAVFRFTLDEHLTAKPNGAAIAKGALTKQFELDGYPLESNVNFESVYGRSRALIVGTYAFDDSTHFASFDQDKIQKDIAALDEALAANGFTVSKLIAAHTSRSEVVRAIEDFINTSEPDDRLFIYFSTHGFADPLDPSAGWLATSDCEMMRPSLACLSLAELQRQSERALSGRKVKQVLIAVDSCFSGLGVVAKSASIPNFSLLAARPGAYMLTAGMANQLAYIDPTLGMSTFTHFLAKGLKGEARLFDRNGLITLSELYLYVQYHVALQSNSQQIPMMGRLLGEGEMVFRPKMLEGEKP